LALEQDELLTVAQIAEQVQVTPETVRRWIKTGQLRGHAVSRRLGFRVRRADLNEFLKLRDSTPLAVSAPEARQPAISVLDRVTARR
jgi:excisionase family DNA binding protein